MSKVYGLFVLKDTLLPWKIKAMIIQYLPSTQLSYILQKFTKKWDYNILSKHINIEFVVKFPKKWNYEILSERINITDILKNHHLPWKTRRFSRNKSIFLKHLINIPIEWEYDYVIQNKRNKYKSIKQNFEYMVDLCSKYETINGKWNYKHLSILLNKDIMMKGCLSLIKAAPSDYKLCNPSLRDQDISILIKMNISPNKKNWEYALSKTNIPLKYLFDNSDKNFNWMHLSNNVNLTLDFILKNLNKKWDITRLILNPALSTKDKLLLCEKFD